MRDTTVMRRILLAALATIATAQIAARDRVSVQVIVIGATGRLSRESLWPSLFHLFEHVGPGRMSLFGASKDGDRTQFAEILRTAAECGEHAASEDCDVARQEFISSVQFFPVEETSGWKQLGKALMEDEHARKFGDNPIRGRLFYLAVPTQAAASVVSSLRGHVTPDDEDGSVWERVIVEKPIGVDKESAQQLWDSLTSHWAPHAIHLVDHFLAKPAAQLIAGTRIRGGKEFRSLWDWSSNLAHVEVVLQESTDVASNIGTYDGIGALRDVAVNHLSELAALALAPIKVAAPHATSPITENAHPTHRQRSQFLQSLGLASCQSKGLRPIVLGQYEGYQSQLLSNSNASASSSVGSSDQMTGSVVASRTVTAARVSLIVQRPVPAPEGQPRRQGGAGGYPDLLGIPVVLATGKRVGERRLFVRLSFGNLGRLTWLLEGSMPVVLPHNRTDCGDADSAADGTADQSTLCRLSRVADSLPLWNDDPAAEVDGWRVVRVDGPAIVWERPVVSGKQLPVLPYIPPPMQWLGPGPAADAPVQIAVWDPAEQAAALHPKPAGHEPLTWTDVNTRLMASGRDAADHARVFVAAVRGDFTMFTAWEEVEAQWQLWDPIIATAEGATSRVSEVDPNGEQTEARLEDDGQIGIPLEIYPPGNRTWLGISGPASWIRCDDAHCCLGDPAKPFGTVGRLPPLLRQLADEIRRKAESEQQRQSETRKCIQPDGTVTTCAFE